MKNTDLFSINRVTELTLTIIMTFISKITSVTICPASAFQF